MIRKAQRHGYGEGVITGWSALAGYTVRNEAEKLGYEAVANRDGDPIETELKPTTAEDARPASLSAMVGLAAQPLHTDGAHLKEPPDLVVLWTEEPNRTSTRVWVPWEAIPRAAIHGMFVVSTGRENWFAPAIRAHSSLRYDPGCMEPADAAARELSTLFQNPPESEVSEVSWDSPGKIAVINNRRALHGRASVEDDDTARVLHRLGLRQVRR